MIDKLIECFSPQKYDFSERSQRLELKFFILGSSLPKIEKLKSILLLFPKRDKVEISLTNSIEDYCEVSSNEDKWNNYSQFQAENNDDDLIKVSINIEKEISENRLSIYKWESFTNELLQCNLIEIMNVFNYLLLGKNYLIFELYDTDIAFMTETMMFKNVKSKSLIVDQNELNRRSKIKICKDISVFYNSADYEIIPNDFHFISNFIGNPLEERFKQIETLLSMAYIANTSFIEKNILKLQFCGQRNQDYSYEIEEQFPDNEELFKIFDWIYTDGNPSDKVALARNIISLHCKYVELSYIDEKVFYSIKSNYSIYLKNNVDKYIDLKNKLADFIIKITSQMGDIILKFTDRLKNNFLAMLTFIFTTFLANLISDRGVTDLFTKDITILVYLILTVSIVYLIISVWEFNLKLNKLEVGYSELKNNYKDLLDDYDIKVVFSFDKKYNEELKKAKKSRLFIIFFWLVFIIIAFLCVDYLSDISCIFQNKK